jgi:hypothetical protein
MGVAPALKNADICVLDEGKNADPTRDKTILVADLAG